MAKLTHLKENEKAYIIGYSSSKLDLETIEKLKKNGLTVDSVITKLSNNNYSISDGMTYSYNFNDGLANQIIVAEEPLKWNKDIFDWCVACFEIGQDISELEHKQIVDLITYYRNMSRRSLFYCVTLDSSITEYVFSVPMPEGLSAMSQIYIKGFENLITDHIHSNIEITYIKTIDNNFQIYFKLKKD